MQRRTLLKAFALSASTVLMGYSFQVYAADTIKVGIMHSLSGTMAISETPLKDVALMAIDDINAKGGVLGKSSSRWWSIPPQTGRCLPRKPASC
jgi:urea transport system substrate-binding protein